MKVPNQRQKFGKKESEEKLKKEEQKGAGTVTQIQPAAVSQ